MRNAHAIFFVYSITNILSFESLQRYWIPFANDFAPRDAVRVLIGSKSDQPELRAVPTILGKVICTVKSCLIIDKRHLRFLKLLMLRC